MVCFFCLRLPKHQINSLLKCIFNVCLMSPSTLLSFTLSQSLPFCLSLFSFMQWFWAVSLGVWPLCCRVSTRHSTWLCLPSSSSTVCPIVPCCMCAVRCSPSPSSRWSWRKSVLIGLLSLSICCARHRWDFTCLLLFLHWIQFSAFIICFLLPPCAFNIASAIKKTCSLFWKVHRPNRIWKKRNLQRWN